ncbi:hypothetical protein [Streptomyces sp. SID10815]|uniref:hypothetical protein n=1 Tax=Streptomyces sp. SID10815 TaxID=2706027 RepID=UPI0013CC9CDA|nr:hypothetical protein [Streptomyces sp. SID10815]NEA52343.1 hypothetical protein [Streptomyces sp. SID10815]
MPRTQPHVYEPVPTAVRAFSERHMPTQVVAAEREMQFAARELNRPCDPLSVEDMGDREEAFAMYRRADKVVSSHPERMGSHLRSLS